MELFTVFWVFVCSISSPTSDVSAVSAVWHCPQDNVSDQSRGGWLYQQRLELMKTWTMTHKRRFVTLTQTGLDTRYTLYRFILSSLATAHRDLYTRWNIFHIYYYHIADNPSDLPCYLDSSLGFKSRLFKNNLSSAHNKQITSQKWTEIVFHGADTVL